MKKKNEKKEAKGEVQRSPQDCECKVMVESRLHRLIEINRQVVTLCKEQDRLLQSFLPEGDQELSFSDPKRRISWAGGSVKLGKKSYLLVKTIWLSEDHQVEFSELEESTWNKQLEEKGKVFFSPQTISMLVQQTQKNLVEANFPYEIESLKNNSSLGFEGFRLVFQTARKES
jgi:hypothetical protein